ncbi:MAG TPA: hypothetical protein VLA56_19765 [Pseudomonadales bacterium]|nr:hypothetical protein [Pseudomonadales bacterium]
MRTRRGAVDAVDALDVRPFARLVAAFALANLVAAQILHEAGHWLVLTATGRQPVWGITALVQLWERTPVDPSAWTRFDSPAGDAGWLHVASLPGSDGEWAAFIAAGPLAQIVAIGIGLWLGARSASSSARTAGVLVAFVNGLTLLLYQVVGAVRGGGSDETLLEVYAGVPWSVAAGAFGLAAAAGLVVATARLADLRTRARWFGAAVLGGLATGPLFAGLQRAIIDGVDRGDPWFAPIMGFSLPVLLLAVGGAAALAALLRVRGGSERA